MARQRTVFITGATGMLGSYLTRVFLSNGHRVYALARNKGKRSAQERVIDTLSFWDYRVLDEYRNNLIVTEGDVIEENLGFDEKAKNILKNEIEEVFHCAAATQFNAPLNDLRKVNVEGTKNVLELILDFNKNKLSKKINYISTAFVCGNYNGSFTENDFNIGQKFNNNYEQSKFEAETLVRDYIKKGAAVTIFRPGILVGEYISGKTIDFKMFYEPLRLFSLEIFEEVPLDTKTLLNLVPVDFAAKNIYFLSAGNDKNKIYHITSPNSFPITYIIDEASKFFNFKKPKYIDLYGYHDAGEVSPTAKRILETYVAYFNFFTVFNSDKTQTVIRKYCFEDPVLDEDFLNRLFRFCNLRKFIKIKE